MSLRIVPINADTANRFIAAWHRHHQPPVGMLWPIGVASGDTLVGVVTIGRPVARAYNDGLTVEITRCATDGTPNTCSMLYSAAWRSAKARGYQRALTYTRDDETGASLRAAGWIHAASLRARSGWDCPSRGRDNSTYDPIGRHRWCIGAWTRGTGGDLIPDRGIPFPAAVAQPDATIVGQVDLLAVLGGAA